MCSRVRCLGFPSNCAARLDHLPGAECDLTTSTGQAWGLWTRRVWVVRSALLMFPLLMLLTSPVPVFGQFVYVANFRGYISAYTINGTNGALTAVPGSPFPAGQKSAGRITVDPKGRFVYMPGDGKLLAYVINLTSGALTALPGSPFLAGDFPEGVAVEPTGRFLYVTNSNSNNVSVFGIDATTGALTPVSGSPFAAGKSPGGLL